MVIYIRKNPVFWICILQFLMVFQACGWLMILQGVQWNLKSHAKQLISEKITPIETHTIPLHIFNSARIGKHEIQLEGKLFDIKSISFLKDSVRLDMYHDHKEEKFVNHWQSCWSGSHTDNTPANHADLLLAKWIGSAYINCPQENLSMITSPICSIKPHDRQQYGAQATPSVLSPPPRHA